MIGNWQLANSLAGRFEDRVAESRSCAGNCRLADTSRSSIAGHNFCDDFAWITIQLDHLIGIVVALYTPTIGKSNLAEHGLSHCHGNRTFHLGFDTIG